MTKNHKSYYILSLITRRLKPPRFELRGIITGSRCAAPGSEKRVVHGEPRRHMAQDRLGEFGRATISRVGYAEKIH